MFGAERPAPQRGDAAERSQFGTTVAAAGGDRPRSPAECGNTGQRVSVFSKSSPPGFCLLISGMQPFPNQGFQRLPCFVSTPAKYPPREKRFLLWGVLC